MPSIYIIEVIINLLGTFYKVGFTDVADQSRPNGLVKKYHEQNPNNKVKLLKVFELPIKKGKYFDDDMVRAEMCLEHFIDIRPVNPLFIAQNIGVDGKNELIEVDSSIDVVDAVETAINTLAKDEKNYRYELRTLIAYPEGFPHLVSGKVLNKLENYRGLPTFKIKNGNILLVGQYEPLWLATIAANNTVYISTDDADMHADFRNYELLQNNIIYIKNIEEIFNMDITFNLIINNPPYGSTGANITQNIKDNVKYDEFINLLPANDYKRNDTKDLFNYQSDMICINGFADTKVTTHLAKIHKDKVNNMSLDDFEISNYVDKTLTKYFAKNRAIKYPAIDNANSWLIYSVCNSLTDVILPHKFVYGDIYYSCLDMTVREKRLSTKKDGIEYQWNYRLIDRDYLIQQNLSPSTPGKMNKYNIQFETELEKTNFVNFMYSDEGFRFFNKILMALNSDSTVELFKWVPKVDWHKAWTLPEILTEYGYTVDEIKEILDDLKNFKGLD